MLGHAFESRAGGEPSAFCFPLIIKISQGRRPKSNTSPDDRMEGAVFPSSVRPIISRRLTNRLRRGRDACELHHSFSPPSAFRALSIWLFVRKWRRP